MNTAAGVTTKPAVQCQPWCEADHESQTGDDRPCLRSRVGAHDVDGEPVVLMLQQFGDDEPVVLLHPAGGILVSDLETLVAGLDEMTMSAMPAQGQATTKTTAPSSLLDLARLALDELLAVASQRGYAEGLAAGKLRFGAGSCCTKSE